MRFKKFISVLLSVILSLACLSAATIAEQEGTEELWRRETDISPDLRMVETVFSNGSRQSEHYICYRPGGSVMPSLAYGESILDKSLFPEAAERAEGRVLAGVNGDYFVMATGMPLGIVLHDGELISSDAGNYAFGFQEDGSAILGAPGLRMLLSSEGIQCSVNSLNKNYKTGEFSIYSASWGETVPLTGEYRCVRLIPEEGKRITAGGDLRCAVQSVSLESGAVSIPEGSLLLCFDGPEEAWLSAGMDSLAPDMPVVLSIRAADERFETCREALGCLYPLISKGEVLPGLDDIDENKAPRTALGIRGDGTVIFYTADGRQSGYAIGLTLAEVASRLLEMGCEQAGILDGGASTVLACRLPGEDTCVVRNAPSLGRLRETPQFLLLTAPSESDGNLKTVGVYCEEKLLLAGSSCSFRAGGCDEHGAPVELTRLLWSADTGELDETGCFTAPDAACEVTVTAQAGEVTGELRIPVITEPDSIRLIREDSGEEVRQLRLLPGSELPLSAEVFWNRMKVCSSDELLQWSLEGEIGSIDESGLFTASEKAAAGAICVRCGEALARLSISVTDSVVCGEDFEKMEPGSVPGLQWAPESNRDKVKYGSGSLRLDYDLTEGSVSFPLDQYPTELGKHVSIWVLSDGSGNNLYSVHKGITLLLGKLEHKGWMQFTVDTALFGRMEALRIGGSGKGSLWLDQLMISMAGEPDLEAPVLQLENGENRLNALIWDRAEGILPKEQLELTADGDALTFEYDGRLGIVTAELPETAHVVRVTLTAADRSGNYNSASLLLGNPHEPGFADMDGHWAKPYVDHLKGLGVLAGRPAEDGSVYFDPNSRITRAEFAVMLCRWLGVNADDFDGSISFTDEDAIPEWAKDSVKAVAALGLIQGAVSEQGLIFMPQQSLTRAQAAVILGRTMPGGRMMADLPWPDAGDIPEWARSYVSELAFMGVMTGDGETFDPNGPLTRAQAAKLLSELT